VNWLTRILNWRQEQHNFYPSLEIANMSGSATITMGDGIVHSAVLTCTNLDSTPASGVNFAYYSDNPAVCTVEVNFGRLTPVAAGTCNITGTGIRNGITHSDSIALTVANEDFTAVLSIT
jgi:uncharacterized protein YjdB